MQNHSFWYTFLTEMKILTLKRKIINYSQCYTKKRTSKGQLKQANVGRNQIYFEVTYHLITLVKRLNLKNLKWWQVLNQYHPIKPSIPFGSVGACFCFMDMPMLFQATHQSIHVLVLSVPVSKHSSHLLGFVPVNLASFLHHHQPQWLGHCLPCKRPIFLISGDPAPHLLLPQKASVQALVR